MTDYVVLAKMKDQEGCWVEGPTVEAASAEAALRMAINGGEGNKTLVAVPARSWKPISVTIETVKHIRLGDQPVAAAEETPAA